MFIYCLINFGWFRLLIEDSDDGVLVLDCDWRLFVLEVLGMLERWSLGFVFRFVVVGGRLYV